VTGLSNVVRGWVDYYVTTTETPKFEEEITSPNRAALLSSLGLIASR
jgi:hypothetical protein